ncbi:MAG: MBL fold metallo-hydrolase [Pseudomonadota bacterium]
MNRRGFIKKLWYWGWRGLLAALVPAGIFSYSASRRRQMLAAEAQAKANGLTLRESARRRIHHGNSGFINPFVQAEYGNPWGIIKWKFFSKNELKSFYDQETVRPVAIDWNKVAGHQGLSVTFIKHACVMIKDQDQIFLLDPIFGNVFPLIKDFSPLAFELKEMPRPDHILVTHGHYDHLDVRSLAFFGPDTHVITPLGYDEVFSGLELKNRTRLDWFESYRIEGREVVLAPCNHWTMRSPWRGPNHSLWGSFVIKTRTGPVIFVSGDAGWFDHYRELGGYFDIDLAIFNLGAYEPRWFMKHSHMNPQEVVQAFRELGARRLMVVHWGSFRLGDEPVYFPPQDIQREMARNGLIDRLVHLDHGQTLFYSDHDQVRIS